MGKVRIGRVNDEIMKALAQALRSVKDPRVSGGFVSITRVEAANDLGSAKVYVSVLGDEAAKKDCMKGLNSASGFLRRELSRAMRLRHTPELFFSCDDSIVTGGRIMELIGNVSKKEEEQRTLSVESCAEFLKVCEDALILTHKSPDGDAAGSAIALALILRALGKTAYVFKNPEFTKKLARRAKSLYAPEGFAPRSIIAVDCADIKLISKEAEEYASEICLAIDHHETHKAYAQKSLVVPTAAACGEIIFDIAEKLSVRLSKKLAEALYIAISTDTGRFLHSNTTPETHRKAAILLERGVDFNAINREFFVEKSKARVALEAALMADLRLEFGGKVGIIKLSRELMKKTKATEEDCENLSELTRTVSGVEVGVYIKEKDGMAKLSVRSGKLLNAAKLCAAFGGGGHEGAAGAALPVSIDEMEEKVISEISKLNIF